MRRTERPPAALLSLLVLLLLLFAAPAFAQEDEEEEEYEEESAFMGYLGRAGTNALGGMNGLITAPADPVAASIEPPEALGEGVGGHLLGFGAGMLQMPYRVMMGGVDVALALVPAMPMVGPLPRYKVIPYTHPEE